MSVENNKDVSLAETAYRNIKDEILQNKFPSGEFISISDLSDSLEGMGRTPVREAVQRLHDERLLIVVPRKGIIIPEFDIKKMMDQLEVRYVLERYASVKAAGRISDAIVEEIEEIIDIMESHREDNAFKLAKLNLAFHMKIVQSINNQELTQTLSRIYDHHIRIYTHFMANQLRLFNTQEEHKIILEAIKDGDIDRIEKAIDEHYENTRRELLDTLMA